ncbi:cobalamin binding intrinsic factor-like [Carcharodon carcharias]|uniref:cobalamin binding intrinsic factor-like n=1 Tax=Carcharodon carcharias TaxID=13397 RepID=UPI001B7E98D6|nr:cobalamin binding intrinsic factor-like [Carcharodon carcharias]
MAQSVTRDNLNPNPSVHIALRLARDHNMEMEKVLLQELKEGAVRKVLAGEDFSSGLVALYTLAVSASCNDPTQVTANGNTINLIEILQEKLTNEIKHIEATTFPLSSYYEVSLDVLTLCVMNSPISQCKIQVLIDAVLKDKFIYGLDFSVDTGAVAALALRCVKDTGNNMKTTDLENALLKVLTQILHHVKSDGTIGNRYSTGLAIQLVTRAKRVGRVHVLINSSSTGKALSVNSDLTPTGSWNQSKSLEKLLSEIHKGSFSNPAAASQIVPSLEGRTYLDVTRLNCSADQDNLTLPGTSTSSPPVTKGVPITVEYNIADTLMHTFSDAVNMTVPKGSPLIQVLEAAQHLYPVRFSFSVTMTKWGPSLTRIRGLSASREDRTYWKLLNGSKPLDQGIGDYRPVNGERIFAKLSHY